MLSLTVDLQDGFFDDTVVVTSEGRSILEKAKARTQVQIGMAYSANVSLVPGHHVLHIQLVEKEVETDIHINLTRALYLGLSFTPEKGIQHRIQEVPFMYA